MFLDPATKLLEWTKSEAVARRAAVTALFAMSPRSGSDLGRLRCVRRSVGEFLFRTPAQRANIERAAEALDLARMTADMLERQRGEEGPRVNQEAEWHVRDLWPTTWNGVARIFEGTVLTLVLWMYALMFPVEAATAALYVLNAAGFTASIYMMGKLWRAKMWQE